MPLSPKSESKTMFLVIILMTLWIIIFMSTMIWFPKPDWRNICKYTKLYSLQASAATIIPFYHFLRGSGIAVWCIIKDRVTSSLTTFFILSGILWILCELLLFFYLSGYVNILTNWYHVVVLGLFFFCFVLYHVIALILDRILVKKQGKATPFFAVLTYVLLWVVLFEVLFLWPAC